MRGDRDKARGGGVRREDVGLGEERGEKTEGEILGESGGRKRERGGE